MSMNLRLDGFPRLLDALKRLNGTAQKAAAGALYREAERIMADSKANYVPVDTGSLRASGQVRRPVTVGTVTTVEMGFGNGSVGYAVIVHEIPPARLGRRQALAEAYNDPTFARAQGRLQTFAIHGKGYKYLERPLNAAREGMDQRLAEDIGERIEREGGAR